jgi:hypothetical protein
VYTYFGDSYRGVDRGGQHKNRWALKFSDVDVQLRHLRAGHRDRHGVLARIAFVRLQRRKTVVLRLAMVVVVGCR